MGVPAFFVISGFNVVNIIKKRFNGNLNSKSILKFYFSRFKALSVGWYLSIFNFCFIKIILVDILNMSISFLQGINTEVLSIVLNVFFLNGLVPFCNNNVVVVGWYIGALAILYLLTPLIIKLIKKFKNRKIFFVISSIALMIVWLILYTIFYDIFMANGFVYFIFIVHYPSYLLGIFLNLDFYESRLNHKRTGLCLKTGIVIFILSIITYFLSPYAVIVSNWLAALSTYLILYYMIYKEQNGKEYAKTIINRIVIRFGKISYYIYLSHMFSLWAIIYLMQYVLEIDIINYKYFILLMPFALLFSYISGYLFNKVSTTISKIVFKSLEKKD
jgi:peptidoglycan/LPS O-acetylase OafA/YrhL